MKLVYGLQSVGTELVRVVVVVSRENFRRRWSVVVGYNIQHVSTDRASACNLYTYQTVDDKSFVRADKTSC